MNETFKTKYPILYDSIFYVVDGKADNQADFDQNIMSFIMEQFKHYKPIGIATTGECYFGGNAVPGFVYGDQPDFRKKFVTAIAHQRFWGSEV